MTDQLKLRYVMLFSTLFIVLNTFFIAKEMYWFMVLPVLLLVVLTAFVALDVLVLVIVFLTPLSIILRESDFGVAISLPTEPLLFGVMLIYILRLFYEGKIERKIFFHPVTIAVLINLLWMAFTCITSSLPMVSWKFLLSRLWLVIPFYFVALHLFREKKNMRKYIWLYMISFSIVIIYTLINHAMDNFAEAPAHIAMTPFYNDHTSYGAMLAMYLPPLILFSFDKNSPRGIRYYAFFTLLLFIAGLIFSYTRAAWLSLIFAAGSLLIYLLRIRLIPILIALGVLIVLFFVYQNEIMISLQSGRYKNVKNRDIEQRLQSIANVTTDASNTERFNRWASAIRMFKQKPFFGWGPGTYQFQYAPFQISTEKTQISTNFGEKGNAHSEYIGPLAESGVIGMLAMIAIVVTTLLTAAKIIYHSPDKKARVFALAIILGLITYFVHGTLNNFLDTDKASAPFWGFIAMLVAMDSYGVEMDVNTKGNKKVD
ncbi:MAG: O-antigen ligase family protein [Bacteroidetes bacterium]|nr:O-antigen ligase family protein [Bacteroidota bacterium]